MRKRERFMSVSFIECGSPDDSSIEDRYRSRPPGGGAADLGREAAYGEAVARQGFEVVQLLQMAVANFTARLVTFPDQPCVTGLGELLGRLQNVEAEQRRP